VELTVRFYQEEYRMSDNRGSSASRFFQVTIARYLRLIAFVALGCTSTSLGADVIQQGQAALHRGVYEIEIHAEENLANPWFDAAFQVTFRRPDGSDVLVDGFYDGQQTFKARAYCQTRGRWTYVTNSDVGSLDGKEGAFSVRASDLPGKLRIHSQDRRQFAYDNGQWFLHIGDTGYRYVVRSEPKWQEYIDEAAAAGFTKIRTWFAQSRSTVEALYTEDRSALALAYWQEIDRRVTYALTHYPHIILQLIPYAEDTKELIRYAKGDRLSRYIARYAQARWSAFPNVHWEISNDREIVPEPDLARLRGRQVSHRVIAQIGRDMRQREPWGTLITNQQSRGKGYSFVDEPWSDIITLEDLDQVGGQMVLEYRQKGNDPVVLDEDRYENYRDPANRRYFFRRFMWANLLSGGHATYGGLRTYEPYDGGPIRGVQGYYAANRRGVLAQGAHDFRHIHMFFEDTKVTLVGMQPDDALVGGDPLKAKCIHDDDTYIVYAPNPDGGTPRTDSPRIEQPRISIKLPEGSYAVRWYNPRAGTWEKDETVSGGQDLPLKAPQVGRVAYRDWVVLIRRQ
jgi:hypothetical protein